jgi:hypothetical protein
MAPSVRDRITVDLHGLKAALLERARVLGVSPSDLVRSVLSEALDVPAVVPRRLVGRRADNPRDRIRVSLRMTREQATTAFHAARRAGLTPGDYLAGLTAGVPALMAGTNRMDHIAALVASSAELSTLARDIRHLALLLSQAESQAAREYRQMLDTLQVDVRGHLRLAAGVLADLRPSRSRTQAGHSPSTDSR